jgi:Xaa-Pro aminopeptidase
MNSYRNRLAQLRASMKKQEIDAYIIINTDPHLGEYIPDHWKLVHWLTGFSGSFAIVVIAKKFAGLWTDSRYFLQAEQQLSDSGFSMKKMNVSDEPSWIEWLSSRIKKNSRIGVDGRIISLKYHSDLKNALEGKKIEIEINCDLAGDLWKGRPPLPESTAFDHNIIFSGKERTEKIGEVRELMKNMNIDFHLLSSLDDIMWLLNIRGNDIEYCPLLISFAIVGMDQVLLFADEKKIPLKLAMEFDKIGVTILPYNDISLILSKLKKGSTLLLNPESTNSFLYYSITNNVNIISDISIPGRLKAVKNNIETENLRKVMVKDGVAMTKFLYWLDNNIANRSVSELSAADIILEFRLQQADCTGASFPTITAFKDHGALVHYTPSAESNYLLEKDGIFLIDSGGQYLDGTTDITRTVPVGLSGDMEKRDYTLVLKGLINIAMARFPAGTKGIQLDILARQALWSNGLNYGHGTGHGVGFFLNVHEGPQNIGTGLTNGKQWPLEPGMVLSDEPAIYRDGKYGIRLENLLLIVDDRTTEFGHFLKFETLSLCCFEKSLINESLLDTAEINWLNDYHSTLYKKISPLLTEEEKNWLAMKTKEY